MLVSQMSCFRCINLVLSSYEKRLKMLQIWVSQYGGFRLQTKQQLSGFFKTKMMSVGSVTCGKLKAEKNAGWTCYISKLKSVQSCYRAELT